MKFQNVAKLEDGEGTQIIGSRRSLVLSHVAKVSK